MLLVWSGNPAAASLCPPQGSVQWYQLERVIDGDTLYLQGGLKVRVLGINTPETGRGQPSQPLASEARRAVEDFFAADRQVGLQTGSDGADRYGRTLAHVYNRQGDNLAAHLLADGFGWLVIMSPNTRYASCLASQRQLARAAGRGVWSIAAYRPLDSARLQAGDDGFRLVTGTITRVNDSRNSWWLETGKLAIRIRHSDLQYFAGLEPAKLLGQTITASGWLIDRSDSRVVREKAYLPFMLNVSHPLMLQQSPQNLHHQPN